MTANFSLFQLGNSGRAAQSKLSGLLYSRAEIDQSLQSFYLRHEPQTPSNHSADDVSFLEFSKSADKFINVAMRGIKDGTFRLQPAKPIPIIADKVRIIHRFSWPDRFILTHFARCIEHFACSLYSDSLFSYRRGRSDAGARLRVSRYLTQTQSRIWLARRDISKYGESMDHGIIIADFERLFNPEPELVKLMQEACSFPIEADGTIKRNNCGLPTGTFLQVLWENLYLLDLDRTMSSFDRSLYLRFGDDILLLSPDLGLHQSAIAAMDDQVSQRKLDYNGAKVLDRELVRPHLIPRGGVGSSPDDPKPIAEAAYLGMKIDRFGRTGLTRKKADRLRKFILSRLNSMTRLLPAGGPAEDRAALLCMGIGILVKTPHLFPNNPVWDLLFERLSESELKELDRWLALQILRLTFGKGTRRGDFRRLPFKNLRRLGLPSLRHTARVHGLL